MILQIAIDGACRRNGKPDCIASGGCFVALRDESLNIVRTDLLSNYEVASTNQRGEMIALLTALQHVNATKLPAQIITDSEYIFNAMTKEWPARWRANSWLTATEDSVKNADIWNDIWNAYMPIREKVVFYHIKGHTISIGKVTTQTLLSNDLSGMLLYEAAMRKFEEVFERPDKKFIFEVAQELSEKNNGFELEYNILSSFVALNLVADAIATRCVEAADLL